MMKNFVQSAPAAPLQGQEFQSSLITKLVNFLNASNCAFNIVNNEETKELVEFLRPGTKMPSAERVKKGAAALAEKGRAEVRTRFPCFNISNSLALQFCRPSSIINYLFCVFPLQLRKMLLLQKGIGVALTTDGGTGHTGKVQAITVHWINENFEYCSALLDLASLSDCLLYTSPSPRDRQKSRMPSSA